MAKVIQNEQNVVVEPWWAKQKSLYIGIGAGVVWWVLTAMMRQYIVEPLACRDLSSATACVNSLDVSGNIAAVLVAALGVAALIRYSQPRPIIVALAPLVLLWGLGGMMNGLAWYWTLLWVVVLYGASYGLFLMVARIKNMPLALTAAIVIVVGVRLLLAA